MIIKTIHPFPARMAPELAFNGISELKPCSVVLDPMAGSGTVLRHASEMGHTTIGFDMDPLAVLMSTVWTTPINEAVVRVMADRVFKLVAKANTLELQWIDDDKETNDFVKFWFGAKQEHDLRKIAYSLNVVGKQILSSDEVASLNVLKVALSRIIITKKKGASLAWDVSHSRPHKVIEQSDYDVLPEYRKSIDAVIKVLVASPPKGKTSVSVGDARMMATVKNKSVDLILTSPPYLNQIDYMRGHKLSLVWLGYSLNKLRSIRSNSIGSERKPSNEATSHFSKIKDAICSDEDVPNRTQQMILRYSEDLYRIAKESKRVLRRNGRAIYVVGNSCLKGKFINNSKGLIKACSYNGLHLLHQVERELPLNSRYLPLPTNSTNPLSLRMRTELVLTFESN